MKMFWFFQLWFRQAYDSAYHFHLVVSALTYNSKYDSESNSVATESQALEYTVA